MDIKEIQNLIKFVAKSGASEVKLEMDDVKITIKITSDTPETKIIQATPITTVPQVANPDLAQVQANLETTAPPESIENNSKYITIKSPMIGTLYRKSSPDKPTFVEVGSEVKVGDTICIIEAMKLFNEIESEVSGKIVKVLVDDSSPVEFDQPLFLVDPS